MDELRILCTDPVYPHQTGSFLRTFNIARLASEKFNRTTIFSTDDRIEYSGNREGVNFIQIKKYSNFLDQAAYLSRGLFSHKFFLKSSPKAFEHVENSIFQLEVPYYYHLIKRHHIDRFILDEHNVCWEIFSFPGNNLKYQIFNALTHERNKQIEIRALQEAAQILVCSGRDKEVFLRELPSIRDKITVIPNCVNFPEYEGYSRAMGSIQSGEDIPRILFMGTYEYPPNIDAVYTICSTIAPEVYADVKFLIIGKNPPAISHPENVEFLGYVEDIKNFIASSDICIAPLRYGSGSRLKILEYMALGKPVITTTKGAEGIECTSGHDIIIEDDFKAYPEVIRDLLEDEVLRRELGDHARKLIRTRYDWRIYRDALHGIYEAVA